MADAATAPVPDTTASLRARLWAREQELARIRAHLREVRRDAPSSPVWIVADLLLRDS